ncbi:unnamed protein product [Ixodes persulcatus]
MSETYQTPTDRDDGVEWFTTRLPSRDMIYSRKYIKLRRRRVNSVIKPCFQVRHLMWFNLNRSSIACDLKVIFCKTKPEESSALCILLSRVMIKLTQMGVFTFLLTKITRIEY